jgi:trehalose 6-phosphate phosphatase
LEIEDLEIGEFTDRVLGAERIRLFLDYDGTLAEFAPTPDIIEPEPYLADLVGRLAAHPRILTSVVSGRRLEHVQALLPVDGILMAGTYGVEMRLPDGQALERVSHDLIRPVLEEVKEQWTELLHDRPGYFLEDKYWAVAIHGRHATDGEEEEVLRIGRSQAEATLAELPPQQAELFRILGGYKFVELGPVLANKGKTITYLLEERPWNGALPVFLGDDDKDEEAFEIIRNHGGMSLLVNRVPRKTFAHARVATPQDARRWLEDLLRLYAD